MCGEPGIGARRAKKSVQSLRNTDGSYHELHARAPDGESTRCYAGPDKKLRSILTEQSTKKLLAVLKDLYAQLSWFGLKRDGIVTVGWDKVAKIEIQAKDKCPGIRFNAEMV